MPCTDAVAEVQICDGNTVSCSHFSQVGVVGAGIGIIAVHCAWGWFALVI